MGVGDGDWGGRAVGTPTGDGLRVRTISRDSGDGLRSRRTSWTGDDLEVAVTETGDSCCGGWPAKWTG